MVNLKSNFDFLQDKQIFSSFRDACFEAEKSIEVSPATAAMLTRRALELSIKWMYTFDQDLTLPYRDNISSLIHEDSFHDIIDPKLFLLMKYVIGLGNKVAHTNKVVKRDEAVLALRNLYEVVAWMDYCYADEYTATDFDETLLATGIQKRVTPAELQAQVDKLSARDRKLADMIKENEAMRAELSLKRVDKTNVITYDFKVDAATEKQTREAYIDLELALSGWDSKQIIEEYPLSNMPTESKNGFVDYVLMGANGKPLALVEAKRSTKDPDVGQQQAKIYADCLEAETGHRPLIFYTNGFETMFWDDAMGYKPRRVAGIFTPDEMALKMGRRTDLKSLKNVGIDDSISSRWYQKAAISHVCDAIERKRRKMLLVMATGSGKTRTAISLVNVLTKANHVKNILFLADRTALVRQAKRSAE